MGTPACAPRILGREAEIRALAGTLDQAASGVPSMALLEDEAGVGKTRLLEHALQDAVERGMQVVSGSTEELERTGRLACWPPRPGAPAHRLTRGGRRWPRYWPGAVTTRT